MRRLRRSLLPPFHQGDSAIRPVGKNKQRIRKGRLLGEPAECGECEKGSHQKEILNKRKDSGTLMLPLELLSKKRQKQVSPFKGILINIMAPPCAAAEIIMPTAY